MSGSEEVERLIGEYSYRGFSPVQISTFEKDQQFARPIEDEDIFGFGDYDEQKSSTTLDIDLDEKPVDDSPSKNGIYNELPKLIYEYEIVRDASPIRNDESHKKIDDVFIDDYSMSPDPAIRSESNITTSNEENINPITYTKHAPSILDPLPPSPAQLKKQQMKERLLQQARSMNLQPRGIGTGFTNDGTIEITLDQGQLISDTTSKFIFHKLVNKSKRRTIAKEGIYEPWQVQKDILRKCICSKKRKIWDSFQAPVDLYDEEEELDASSEDEQKDNGSSKDHEDGQSSVDEDFEGHAKRKDVSDDDQEEEEGILGDFDFAGEVEDEESEVEDEEGDAEDEESEVEDEGGVNGDKDDDGGRKRVHGKHFIDDEAESCNGPEIVADDDDSDY